MFVVQEKTAAGWNDIFESRKLEVAEKRFNKLLSSKTQRPMRIVFDDFGPRAN